MALANLVTDSRAAQNPLLANLQASNYPYFDSLLAAASQAIRKDCLRDFTSNTYTEYHSGGIYMREPILLREYPITAGPSFKTANKCLWIQNSSNAGLIQIANVETLSTGDIKLTTYSSGVLATNTVSVSTNVTIQAVANAIQALGNGWAVTVFAGSAGSYSLFPSANLKLLAGQFSALVGGCYLEIFEDWYGWTSLAYWPDEEDGQGSIAPYWRLDENTGELYGRFPRGQKNIRIDYTAGYSTIPADLQEACVQLAVWMYQTGSKDMTVASNKLGEAAYTLRNVWPTHIKMILDTYRATDKTVYYG